eukprot:1344820-Rhodomonas_salina.2
MEFPPGQRRWRTGGEPCRAARLSARCGGTQTARRNGSSAGQTQCLSGLDSAHAPISGEGQQQCERRNVLIAADTTVIPHTAN